MDFVECTAKRLFGRQPGASPGILPVIALLVALLAVAASGCRQQAEDVEPVEATIQPTPMAAKEALAARLPNESLLPSSVNLELVGSGDSLSGTQSPAYLIAELAGRDIKSVSLVAGSVQGDRQRRIMIYEPIDPVPGDDTWPGEWANGVSRLVETWDFAGDYLWDGQRGDYAVLWTSDPESDTRTVHGRYRAQGSDVFMDAVLVVNIVSSRAEDVINKATGEVMPFLAGDVFQLADMILDEGGAINSQAGTSLTFTEGGHIAYTRRPGPSGSYFVGVSAETGDGQTDAIYVPYEVNNERMIARYRAYLDAEQGFQLLYPETWPTPSKQAGRLMFTNPEGSAQMSVSWHPDMSGQPIADLKRQALDAYGEVAVLYEDQVSVGDSGGLRTIYGYQAARGQRTGILLTFSQAGQAYAVDIDGPAEAEGQLLELASVVADSWTNRAIVATGSGEWVEATVDGLAVIAPADHRPLVMSNGWQRFAAEGELAFLAMRSEPANGQGLFNGLEHWLGVAGENVLDFAASDIYAHERSGRSWARADFEYSDGAGAPIGGAIMLTRIGDRFLILWLESPLAELQKYEANVLLTVVDDLSRIP